MGFRGTKQFFGYTLTIVVFGGFLLWIVGRNTTEVDGIVYFIAHVGASGVLFGYFGALMTIPIFERPLQIKSFVSALLGGLLYGGLVISLFNSDPSVSIEGHICGLVVGITSAVVVVVLWPKVIKPRWEMLRGRKNADGVEESNVEGDVPSSDVDLELQQGMPEGVVMVRPVVVEVPIQQPAVISAHAMPPIAPAPFPQASPSSAVFAPIQHQVASGAAPWSASTLTMDDQYYSEVNAIVASEAAKSPGSSEIDDIFSARPAAQSALVAPRAPTSQPNDDFSNPFI